MLFAAGGSQPRGLCGGIMSDDLRSQFNDPNVLFGQQGGSHIELPSLSVTASRLSGDHPNSQKAKEKRLQQFVDIVDAVNAAIASLDKQIKDMEVTFHERNEAWREELALKILDADDIPQPRAGESIQGYHRRLEPLLIAEFLNADGSIKSRYLNDPELADYAQWAQKKFHWNMAQDYIRELEDPSTNPERRAEIYEELRQREDIEALVLAGYSASEKSEVTAKIKETIDTTNIQETREIHTVDTVSRFLKPPN